MSYKDEILFKLEKNEKIRITRRENRNLAKNLNLFTILLGCMVMGTTLYFDGFDWLFIGVTVASVLLFFLGQNLTTNLVDIHVQQDSLLVKHRHKKNIIIYVNLIKDITTFQIFRFTLTRINYKFDGNKFSFLVFKRVSEEKASPERMLRFIQAIQEARKIDMISEIEKKASHKPGSVSPEKQECLSFI